MTKLILYTALTMDGFISGMNDELDWLFHDQDYGYQEFYSKIGCLLWGHTSWRIAGMIPGFQVDETKMNYVFSRSEHESGIQAVRYIKDDIAGFTKTLKSQEQKDIWLVGGGEINGILLEHGLIDELVLSYHPVFLGSGKPLFKTKGNIFPFKNRHTQAFPSGLIQVRLEKSVSI